MLACVFDVCFSAAVFSSNLGFLPKEPFSTLPQGSCQKGSARPIRPEQPLSQGSIPWQKGWEKKQHDGYNNKGKPSGSGTTTQARRDRMKAKALAREAEEERLRLEEEEKKRRRRKKEGKGGGRKERKRKGKGGGKETGAGCCESREGRGGGEEEVVEKRKRTSRPKKSRRRSISSRHLVQRRPPCSPAKSRWIPDPPCQKSLPSWVASRGRGLGHGGSRAVEGGRVKVWVISFAGKV